jgi:hypothetical protein
MLSFKQYLQEMARDIKMPKDADRTIARHGTLKSYLKSWGILRPKGHHQGEFDSVPGRKMIMTHVPAEKKFIFHDKTTGNPGGFFKYERDKGGVIRNGYMHLSSFFQGKGVGKRAATHIKQRHNVDIDDSKVEVTKGGRGVLGIFNKRD